MRVRLNQIFLIYATCIGVLQSDMYLHNPRGSNNRLDEAGRERNNANRMFDSQNNNRGGYNVGNLYYYAGSKLQVEWTNQHSCKNSNNHCEIIVQYMCSNTVRDGVTTKTIPEKREQCENYDCNSDTRYGMHEDFNYYMDCKKRLRNKGLFTADQNLKGRETAKNTRQNPAGTRRGYECPEERDYYPYWHPTPWKDIVVMTNNATRCPYYQTKSENVKGRGACVLPYEVMMQSDWGKWQTMKLPNNKEDCEKFVWPPKEKNGTTATWKEFPSHGIEAPLCRETEYTRDNHLGNGIGGYPNTFNWTLPNIDAEKCVLRIRYNISTSDYDAWQTDASSNKENGENVDIELYKKLGFDSKDEAEKRGYVFKNNPQVQIFNQPKFKLELAVNTAQFGRTFQDRSHVFAIRKRPAHLEGVTIHNKNVRGKRGNIVQVYPAVEYDFVPNTLEITAGDYVHVQWTGSNTNPQNNDGQGRAGTDRNNMVVQRPRFYSEGVEDSPDKFGHWGRSFPNPIFNTTFLGLSAEDLKALAHLTSNQYGGEMSELDDAGTYFDLGPRKVTKVGIHYFLCTRNNNFSNRSQKGRIIVRAELFISEAIGWNGGTMAAPNGQTGMSVERGTFGGLKKVRMEQWQPETAERVLLHQRNRPGSQNFASDVIVIHPEGQLATGGKFITVNIHVEEKWSETIVLYRTYSNNPSTWTSVGQSFDIANNVAHFKTQEGGMYVAVRETRIWIIVAIAATALVVLIVIMMGTYCYCKRNDYERWKAVKRSFADKV